MNQDQALIFEVSKPGRVGYSLPKIDVEEVNLEDKFPERLNSCMKKQNFLKYLNLILCVITQHFQTETTELILDSIHLDLVR